MALSYRGHVHHLLASSWFDGLQAVRVLFCRFTQLGFLRLLTNSRVMGDEVRSQREAWRVYDRWFADPRIGFFSEPASVEPGLRRWTQSPQAIGNNWPDAYLAALAQTTGLTVVTLDQDFMNYPGLDVLARSDEPRP